MSEVTICIVHHDRLEKLQENVRRIREVTPPEAYAIHVYNNGYLDGEIERYLAEGDFEVTYSDRNRGLPAVRAELFDTVETDYVLSLDDDMYVAEGWYERAMDCFEDPSIGVVGFSYRNTDTEDIVQGRNVTWENGVITRTPVETAEATTVAEDVPSGSMAFRREVLSDMRIDDRYRFGFADIDKTLQLMESEWTQVMVTDLLFEHHKDTERDATGKKRLDYNQIRRSYVEFRDKWDARLPMREHLYFNYVYAIPNPLLRGVSKLRSKV